MSEHEKSHPRQQPPGETLSYDVVHYGYLVTSTTSQIWHSSHGILSHLCVFSRYSSIAGVVASVYATAFVLLRSLDGG